MLQNLKKRSEGFTIIEVLIVLAIAGLIMVVVFLAVPALNRNSRNNQRKTEANNVLAAMSEYANNNNGTLPTSGAPFTDALANAKLNFYTGNVTMGTASATVTNNTTLSTLVVVTGVVCNGSNATSTNASARQLVALFTVETGGAATGQKVCQES
jgi:prepilin-type N-terminal cleavage/methylation domain-containing protein